VLWGLDEASISSGGLKEGELTAGQVRDVLRCLGTRLNEVSVSLPTLTQDVCHRE